jgi:hypothetical protein
MYPKEVLEIHNEFDTACDKIIAEAEEFFQSVTAPDTKKASLLEKLGFVQAKEVSEAREFTEKEASRKKMLELARYYKQKYPLNKFITEEMVKQICEKYNLVFGDVSLYTGFVPLEKANMIAQFKVDPKDVPYAIATSNQNSDVFEFEKDEIGKVWVKRFSNPEEWKSCFITTRPGIVNTYSNGPVLKNDAGKKYTHIPFLQLERTKETFQICAPEKDMKTNGMRKSGHKLIPDPVVLRRVRGGYLVVAAWGNEASDPIVVNETMN